MIIKNMSWINKTEIYEILKWLKESESILSDSKIKKLIEDFEDSISCLLTSPEKVNPDLAYDLQLIVSSLIDVLKNKSKNLRKSQIASIVSIIDYLLSHRTRWLIKLPTWTWKTKLFTEIVSSLELPTVILVPKINLKWQTSEYFERENVFEIWENWSAVNDVKNTLKKIKEKNITNPIIIITYQSFVNIKKDNALFEEFSKMIKVVIRDEAHRSLWAKTQEALETMHSYSDVDENDLQNQDKDLLETDILFSNEKLELLFTATPNLLDKSVRDSYEEIFWLKLQDLVEEWVLHMPKYIQVSEASVHVGDLNVWERVLNQFATKFVNENWEFTYKEIVDKYIELKNKNNWYMPTVWFCRDIEQAEFMKNYLEERWIRAIRVTSENANYDKWVDEDEAKKMIESNEVDVVVTVTKVSEWWDVQTLRCALNFAPIFSEAKYIQWIGRTLRTFDYEKNEEENQRNWVLPKNFAYVIEPKFWYIKPWNWSKWWEWIDVEPIGIEKWKKSEKKIIIKISGITHLINSEEFDIGYLKELYWDLDEYGEPISKEEVINFFKEKSAEYWLSLNKKQIIEIEYKWKKIINLAKFSWWTNINDLVVQTYQVV